MDLFLIRHGETVDNIAGLYAGVRDSNLTNHGVEQARRLGEYFASEKVTFSHIFASPLSRALKTAEAIQAKQPTEDSALDITQVPDLIEQDFGFYEGKPFYARASPKKSGKEALRDEHKSDTGFVDVESKDAMAKRADAFLDQHLLPLFDAEKTAGRLCVAVVSHGMLLSNLWKRLLLRLSRSSVSIAPEVTAAKGSIVLEHLGGWSNTGYLQLSLDRLADPEPGRGEHPDPSPEQSAAATATASAPSTPSETILPPKAPSTTKPLTLNGWTTLIKGIDTKPHLAGLKRQRGGIGSSAYDKGQKTLDGFFKRQRTD